MTAAEAAVYQWLLILRGLLHVGLWMHDARIMLAQHARTRQSANVDEQHTAPAAGVQTPSAPKMAKGRKDRTALDRQQVRAA